MLKREIRSEDKSLGTPYARGAVPDYDDDNDDDESRSRKEKQC